MQHTTHPPRLRYELGHLDVRKAGAARQPARAAAEVAHLRHLGDEIGKRIPVSSLRHRDVFGIKVGAAGAAVQVFQVRGGRVVERVDQGPLSRMLAPTLGTLGTLRFTKRGWGILTTYSQELTVTAARLAQQAGTPVGVRVSLQVPGTITGTNATGRDGRTLVWGQIPPDAPLWARTLG